MDLPSVENISLSTDALPNNDTRHVIQKYSCRELTNARVLEQIEEELEDFEKVSILFLIAAEYPGTYKKVQDLYTNIKSRPNILTQFFENNLEFWGEKLLEALCIINNQEILRNLGFTIPPLMNRYHKDIARLTVKINVVAKVLYKLFETLDINKSKRLLQYVYEEDKIERLSDDVKYLELHALHWIELKYITISNDGGNLSNLLRHLKRLNYYSELIYHEVEYFSTSSSQSDSASTGKTDFKQIIQPFTTNNAEPHDEVTAPCIIKKGICVIINEVHFPSTYESREGSDSDRERLRKTFAGLGFDVLLRNDLTEDEITQLFMKISNDFDDTTHNCLVVCILSHGYEGGIITSDGIEMSLKTIEDIVCTWKLRNVIKIVIIQACQGKSTGIVGRNSHLAVDGPSAENILRRRHFVRFMSTMSGFVSIRHKITGSWFIEAVCQVLATKKRLSVTQWSAAVTKIVQRKQGHVNNCRSASQIPELSARLEAEVYFPPYTESSTNNA